MMQIYVWQESQCEEVDGGFLRPLSSMEPFSLALLSYVKMAEMSDYHVNIVNNGNWWVSGTYPVLKNEPTHVVSGWKPTLAYLKNQGYDLDVSLHEKQQGNLHMFSLMVMETIRDALEYYMFIEQENYQKVVHRQLAKQIPYPFRFGAVNRMKNRVEKRLLSLYRSHTRQSDEEEVVIVYEEAARAFKTLSSLLDLKNFFFGPNPTSLDALAFGFLAPIMYMSMHKDTLKRQLMEYPNLVLYCHHMRHWLCDSIVTPVLSPRMSIKEYLCSNRLLYSRKSAADKNSSMSTTNDYHTNRTWALVIGLGIILLYIYIRGKDTATSFIKKQNDLRAVAYLSEMPF
jgi:hypothetical protein